MTFGVRIGPESDAAAPDAFVSPIWRQIARTGPDSAAEQTEQTDVETQVMEGREALGRLIAHLEQVMQIGRGVTCADRTVAALLDRPVVDPVLRIVDADGTIEVVTDRWPPL